MKQLLIHRRKIRKNSPPEKMGHEKLTTSTRLDLPDRRKPTINNRQIEPVIIQGVALVEARVDELVAPPDIQGGPDVAALEDIFVDQIARAGRGLSRRGVY